MAQHTSRRRLLANLLRDHRGGTLPMFAIGLSVLVGAGAVAVDSAQLYAMRSQLQATADSAARSAAWKLPDATVTKRTAIDYAEENMAPAQHGDVLSTEDVTVGTWDFLARGFSGSGPVVNAVRLTTRRAEQNANPVDLIFARIFGPDRTDVVAQATAAKIDITACVLSLASGGIGLEFNGGVEINSPQCGMAANSTDANAALLTEGSSGNVAIQSLYLAGGMTDPGSIIHPTYPPVTNAKRAFEDPYASRQFNDFPTGTSPTHNALSKPSQPVTLEPGVYPSGFTFKGEVTMEPGVYVMRGDVTMSAQAEVFGDGVTIVLDNADINVDGGATTDLTAPTTGSTAGIAVMRQGGASTSTMSGGSSMTINGAIYMPDSELSYAGSSDPGGCLQVVADRVVFSGDTSFNNYCQAAGANDMTMVFTMLVD